MLATSNIPATSWPVAFVGIFISYWVCLSIYRLFFHPLAKFPGPKLAACTHLYEYYFAFLHPPGHQFYRHVEDLHRKYGPIIRINPDEIHLNDITWYGTLFSGQAAGRREKHPPMIRANGSPGAVSSAQTHELHRLRRSALNPFFSKKAVQSLEPVISEKVEKLCVMIKDCYKRGDIIRLDAAFMGLTLDVIVGYSLNFSLGSLDSPEAWEKWHRAFYQIFEGINITRHLPLLFQVMQSMPLWVTKLLDPDIGAALDAKETVKSRVAQLTLEYETKTSKPAKMNDDERSPTIVEELLKSNLPSIEKELDYVADNSFVLVAAGGDTSARVLSNLVYHVLANRTILTKLQEELQTVMPDPAFLPEWRVLETLPFLRAIIKESLRIASALTARVTQVAPDEDLRYAEYVIPRKTPISYNLSTLQRDPATFKDPETFKPERWIPHDPVMENLLFPFSKGTRNCVGQNLAYAELFIAVAALFRRFDMKLHDVVYERDVKAIRDCFVGHPSTVSKGLRVQVTGIRN